MISTRTRSRRARRVMLIMAGLLILVALISGAVGPALQLALAALYSILVVIALAGPALVQDVRYRFVEARKSPVVRSATARSVPTTRAAEAAQERARYIPGYRERHTLMDIGLIGSEVKAGEMDLRRGHRVSLDDQAARPYVILHVPPEYALRQAIVRFEMMDAAGERQFVHEETVYLREGRNNILPTYHLPLRGNPKAASVGLWELRAWVDGAPIGVHSFDVTPSIEERQRWLREQGGVGAPRVDRLREQEEVEDPDAPISLEDLLRGQNRE